MVGGPDAHFRLWLRAGLTGCEFARLLAGRPRSIALEMHLDVAPPAAWLSNVFEAHARAGLVVMVLLPSIVTESAVVEFLSALQMDPRWRVRLGARSSPAGGTLVGVEWSTGSGDISEVMGFAPFPMMPVPRRSPYVALATWPGGRSNPFRGTGSTPSGRPGVVSLLDASHGLDRDAYEERWKRTSERVADLMSVPPDDARLYRRTTFVLTPEQAAKLAVAPS